MAPRSSPQSPAAALNNFPIFFGNVMTTDEAASRLVAAEQRKTA